MTKRRATVAVAATFLLALASGCHKSKTSVPPPPPPAANSPAPETRPTINYFNAEPTTISSGQPSSLRWSVTGGTSVSIDNGIGPVSPNGRRAVYPTGTTTYTLTASGAGGDITATATVTIASAPPPTTTTAPPTQSPADMVRDLLKDVHFDYDKSDVRADDQAVLQSDAQALKTIFQTDPNFVVQIEGNCDERGSAEYNVGLGDRRASATKDALVGMGVPGDKLRTVSYGKERPLCTDENEDCYGRNRRAHFSAGQ